VDGNTGAVSVTAPSTTLNVQAGQSTNLPVTFGGTNPNVAQVTATCLNLPAGATCTCNRTTNTVSIQTLANTPKGNYQVTVVFSVTQLAATMTNHRMLLASAMGLIGMPFALVFVGGLRKKSFRLVLFGSVVVCMALSLVGWIVGLCDAARALDNATRCRERSCPRRAMMMTCSRVVSRASAISFPRLSAAGRPPARAIGSEYARRIKAEDSRISTQA
jgi:hypothetical protein